MAKTPKDGEPKRIPPKRPVTPKKSTPPSSSAKPKKPWWKP